MKSKKISSSTWFGYCAALLIVCSPQLGKSQDIPRHKSIRPDPSRLVLETRDGSEEGGRISTGFYKAFENRETETGRILELSIVILHALDSNPRPDPLFVFAGGPGGDAVNYRRGYARSWMREERDIVLISQRGSSGSHRLDCEYPGGKGDLQAYLDNEFLPELYRDCLGKLQKRADLTQYSTANAMDDICEIRAALGYDKVNLTGGSYGTRAALVYMRRHPETVRSAMLNGVAPMAFTNPLFHAQGAQEALAGLLDLCAANAECSEAFPDLKRKFREIMARLSKTPVEVMVTHPETLRRVPVKLSKDSFAEALRVMMYYTPRNMRVPLLLQKAWEGDFEPFAQLGIESNWGLRDSLAFGLLLCVTCAEDVARIDPRDIPGLTESSYIGDLRVRRQMEICDFWPKSKLPENHADSVSLNIPVLLLSGTLDPVTPPRWGEEAARQLPNSLHIVAPGAHGIGGRCIRTIQRQFLDTGSVADLSTECVKAMTLPPFVYQD